MGDEGNFDGFECVTSPCRELWDNLEAFDSCYYRGKTRGHLDGNWKRMLLASIYDDDVSDLKP